MYFNMLSEYLLGDEGYGGGPSGNTGSGCGCLVFLILSAGIIFARKYGLGDWI